MLLTITASVWTCEPSHSAWLTKRWYQELSDASLASADELMLTTLPALQDESIASRPFKRANLVNQHSRSRGSSRVRREPRIHEF